MYLYSYRMRFSQHTVMVTWLHVSLSDNLGKLLLIAVYYALNLQFFYLLRVTVLAGRFPFTQWKVPYIISSRIEHPLPSSCQTSNCDFQKHTERHVVEII